MTLTEFLLARIAEDETAARAATAGSWVAIADSPSRPRFSSVGDIYFAQNDMPHALIAEAHGCGPDVSPTNVGTHIARHDPARVLAECAAKRGAIKAAWADHCAIEGEWGSGQSEEEMSAEDDNPAVVCFLAAVYSDHPDYRQEWKP